MYGITLTINFYEPRHETQVAAEKFIHAYLDRLAKKDADHSPEIGWDDAEWQITELTGGEEK